MNNNAYLTMFRRMSKILCKKIKLNQHVLTFVKTKKNLLLSIILM
jgi:hypothetical protein